MKTKENKNLLVVGTVLIISFILIGFSSSIQGDEKSYKIKPEITLPEYRTDTARAIDAYERVMNRFINLTERNLTSINTDVNGIAKKLVLIDYKLTELSTRMARIEKALGIEQTVKRVEKPSKAKTPNVTDTNKPGLN
jgi:hypothetical protein